MSEKKKELEVGKDLSSSDEDDDPNIGKPETSHSETNKNSKNNHISNNENNNSGIIEVYKDNLNQEMKNLISLSGEQNFLG